MDMCLAGKLSCSVFRMEVIASIVLLAIVTRDASTIRPERLKLAEHVKVYPRNVASSMIIVMEFHRKHKIAMASRA